MPQQPDSSIQPILNILQKDDFPSLLEDWAGKKIFDRGKAYFKNKRVNKLVVEKNGRLLATVKGSRNYVSALYLDEDEKLDGACTCPYGAPCKHVVALALAAREALLGKKELPPCDDFDFRLEKLGPCPKSMSPVSPEILRKALAKLSRETLLELLLKACELDRNTFILCATRADPDKIGFQALLNDAREAISEAASSPDFDDDYSSGPDYSSIAKKLRVIIAAGKPEAALGLAAEVFNSCENAIEVYDHDGEVIGEVAEVAEAAVAALRETDWAPAKKLVWAINAILWDSFGYCDYLKSYLNEISDSAAWSEAAAYLADLKMEDSLSWRKSTLMGLRKLALAKAGRAGELLRIYELEAKDNNDYLKLADYLLEQGKDDDAEKWIKIGLKNPESPYDAMNLRKRLIRIREKEGNNDAVITLRTEIFVDFPDVKEFEACADAAKATGKWDDLKALLVQYLTEGKLPWLEKTWPCENKGTSSRPQKKFPLYLELTELALYENRPLDALKWYDLQRKSKHGYGISEIRLADAVKDVAPERSFTIWRNNAEKLIAETSTRSYLEAGRYLEKMLALAAKMGDKDRWLPYLRALREQHRRKKNFIKILDSIERGEDLTK